MMRRSFCSANISTHRLDSHPDSRDPAPPLLRSPFLPRPSRSARQLACRRSPAQPSSPTSSSIPTVSSAVTRPAGELSRIPRLSLHLEINRSCRTYPSCRNTTSCLDSFAVGRLDAEIYCNYYLVQIGFSSSWTHFFRGSLGIGLQSPAIHQTCSAP
jgi:hypothetical protein